MVDIVTLIIGPANENARLGQQAGFFLLPKMCILSSLPFLGEMNLLAWTGGFSYTVLSGVQVCQKVCEEEGTEGGLVLASLPPFERGRWSFA